MIMASMVLPLAGGTPSHVLVTVYEDGLMLVYGEMAEEEFFAVDKGNSRRFSFERYPALREVLNADGTICLHKMAVVLAWERKL